MLDPIRLEHFRNLVSLSVADGRIAESEHTALSKIAYEQGIPLDRLNVMLSRASEYTYLIPQNLVECERQLREMIDLAIVDDDFARAEFDLIVAVGEKLGYSREQVELFVKQHLDGHQ
jgi:uncharacterized tellurite resistance protein B-like protein